MIVVSLRSYPHSFCLHISSHEVIVHDMGILHCRSSVILLLACVAAVQGSPGSARLVTAPRAGIRGGPSRYGASEGSALGRRAPLSHRLPHASHTSAEHPTLDVENHVQVRRQASSKTGTAEVPAISEWGSYDEVVTVGTQQVLLTFDTGSQELYVASFATVGQI